MTGVWLLFENCCMTCFLSTIFLSSSALFHYAWEQKTSYQKFSHCQKLYKWVHESQVTRPPEIPAENENDPENL